MLIYPLENSVTIYYANIKTESTKILIQASSQTSNKSSKISVLYQVVIVILLTEENVFLNPQLFCYIDNLLCYITKT